MTDIPVEIAPIYPMSTYVDTVLVNTEYPLKVIGHQYHAGHWRYTLMFDNDDTSFVINGSRWI